jgi:hypothetical protein
LGKGARFALSSFTFHGAKAAAFPPITNHESLITRSTRLPLACVELAETLCDAGEERHFRRALERAGFGSDLTRSDMEQLGFYTCDADLEDELIRALGVDTVLEVLATQGDLGRFRIFQRQPEWEERSNEVQLRRWLGTTAHRKISYAELLVNVLALHRVHSPWSACWRTSLRDETFGHTFGIA